MFENPRQPNYGFVIALLAAAMLMISGLAYADSYSYDASGRLIQVTYSDGSYVTYTYDTAGNRTVVSATP